MNPLTASRLTRLAAALCVLSVSACGLAAPAQLDIEGYRHVRVVRSGQDHQYRIVAKLVKNAKGDWEGPLVMMGGALRRCSLFVPALVKTAVEADSGEYSLAHLHCPGQREENVVLRVDLTFPEFGSRIYAVDIEPDEETGATYSHYMWVL